MKFTLTTRNDFYDGWLAWILGMPMQEERNEAWRDGWNVADETAGSKSSPLGEGRKLMLQAFQHTIFRGHITLEVSDG